MINVVLAGGGTAGHTSPLIATADQIREATSGQARISAIGTARGLETSVVPAAGIELDLIDPVPMPRRPSKDLALVAPRLATAVNQARKILRAREADVLVGFGGYVSMPAYLAARSMGLPIVIHEQNAVPGLANKVAARFTRHVYVSFPDTPLPHSEYLGMPVRRQITDLDVDAERGPARAEFGLAPELPTLLVSGGSQGARSINNALEGARDDLLAHGVQILHVLGAKNMTVEHVRRTDSDTGAVYSPLAYVEKMGRAYAAADLMLGRSGAGTVIETAIAGLPAIFVPLPHGNGEQARNASALVAAGGAQLVLDAELSSALLKEKLPALLHDRPSLDAMRAAGRGLVPADSARQVAERVISIAQEHRRARAGKRPPSWGGH